jgi:glycosyltransferase involved in cell wall biosynthesis
MVKKKILLIEPYYGGSHKRFLDGLTNHIDTRFTLMTLPARKWKMRMQLAAPWFIRELAKLPSAERSFDTVLFSSFIDVAVFKAMVVTLEGWNQRCRYLTYFHENQFCYPGFLDKHTSHQFTSINFTSALVSDSIAFNSEYNRTSFFEHCTSYLDKAADMELAGIISELHKKSTVLYPGIDFTLLDRVERRTSASRVKTIVWNHRWEHDKNPEEFFTTLYRLQDNGIEFNLCMLGQTFKYSPACFDEARERLATNIVQWGHVDNIEEYFAMLAGSDIVVSTAIHEFFGIAVLEAVRAGCVPVLPKRLAYPEIFENRFLYEPGLLYDQLLNALQTGERLSVAESRAITERFGWERLGDNYRMWLIN